MLMQAIVSMNLALIFYSIGVWGEKLSKRLKNWHLALFFSGLIFDSYGTFLMSKISNSPSFLHQLTGEIALFLMLIHAIWASVVYFKQKESLLTSFHKFSLFVWIIWLIPFFNGVISHSFNK